MNNFLKTFKLPLLAIFLSLLYIESMEPVTNMLDESVIECRFQVQAHPDIIIWVEKACKIDSINHSIILYDACINVLLTSHFQLETMGG